MVHNLVFGLNRSARIGTMSDQEDHSEDKHIDSEEDMDNEEEEDMDNLDANKSEEEEEEEAYSDYKDCVRYETCI